MCFAKLVFRCGLFSLMIALVVLCGGCGMPSFLVTPVSNPTELEEAKVVPGNGDKIAIIPVEGMLLDARGGGFLQQQENPLSLFVQELDRAACDDRVKAVVLRVNSPGGSVTTSDTMYRAVQEFRKKTHKPVIASAQELDASGAYYVSCAADKVVVTPTSLVGSVGVIFETFDVVGTMDKLGIKSQAFVSGDLKEMGSPLKHRDDKEKLVIQTLVNDYFAGFTTLVAQNRPLKDNAMDQIKDGRIFSGTSAVELGLADQAGGLDDAIALARTMANTPHAQVVMYKRPYGYGGSIYASNATPQPQANVLQLRLPMELPFLPAGFYYLWQPGLAQ